MKRTTILTLGLTGLALFAVACAGPTDPAGGGSTPLPAHDGSLRIAALDYQIGDLDDPAVMAKYTRADILVAQCDQFWGRASFEGRMAQLRAANPDLKIIGYFRSKVIKQEWGTVPRESQTYNWDLYHAALPYLGTTTMGDTISDWPGAALFDYTDPEARAAMLAVFQQYQATSSNKFDGVYWDYFNESLWIAPFVDSMVGQPDLDSDGVPHWDDADELAAWVAGQDAWVDEMQAAMGPGFIQIANGARALSDSVFAGKLDGMFYEIFPEVGFVGGGKFAMALDPARHNNLWAAHSWPRTTNGGPWLILSHARNVGSYRSPEGTWEQVDPGDFLRVVALLTGATSTHYDLSGAHRAGVPEREFSLGPPLGGVVRDGDVITREFAYGSVRLEMGSGAYPVPFDYRIVENGAVVEEITSTP